MKEETKGAVEDVRLAVVAAVLKWDRTVRTGVLADNGVRDLIGRMALQSKETRDGGGVGVFDVSSKDNLETAVVSFLDDIITRNIGDINKHFPSRTPQYNRLSALRRVCKARAVEMAGLAVKKNTAAGDEKRETLIDESSPAEIEKSIVARAENKASELKKAFGLQYAIIVSKRVTAILEAEQEALAKEMAAAAVAAVADNATAAESVGGAVATAA